MPDRSAAWAVSSTGAAQAPAHATPGEAPAIVHEVLRSPGQPLDRATRASFEPRLGHDFGRVRVHTDARAAESARAVHALAYTVGRDVVFGAGRYAPDTDRGRRLLAHELTHVMQQGASAEPTRADGIDGAGDRYEEEAERASRAVEAADLGSTPRSPRARATQAAPTGVMRAPDEQPPLDISELEVASRGRRERIDPSKVTAGIWWFNGATPTFAFLYPTEQEQTTGLPATGRFRYRVTKGSDKLTLVDGGRPTASLDVADDPNPVVRGTGPSEKQNDVELTIIHTPVGAKRSDLYTAQLQVRAPHHLQLLASSHAAAGGAGWTTTFLMKVFDNFGAPMPYINVNEDFDKATLAPGVSVHWRRAMDARRKGNTITLGDATFEDKYEASITARKPPADVIPPMTAPQSPLGSTLVGRFGQYWFVGSPSTGQGVKVSMHIGTFYADHGEYEGFISPIPSLLEVMRSIGAGILATGAASAGVP